MLRVARASPVSLIKMAAKTLMIQGTGSHVGKSVLTAALCRLLVRRGVKVAPFKAQNMSNNSFVTPDGKEIGRAQAVQAAACRLAPHVDFNPVLIKPSGERTAQLVVNGVVAGNLSAGDFGLIRREHRPAVRAAFNRLSAEFDVVLLEGAGSPAEINLRQHDIVNMAMAKDARAPVLLVGDIDRGGVFAALVGTLELLESDERAHVKGFIINKFRGDPALLAPGLSMLHERTGIGCLGILPHWGALRVPQEDSLGWDSCCPPSGRTMTVTESLTIGIADLPFLSNFTDLDALARERDVRLVRVDGSKEVELDALILPGTKNTPEALKFVRRQRIDRVIDRVLHQGGTIVGLCGGYQMLGRDLLDPDCIESSEPRLRGLGLLDVVTTFAPTKVTVQIHGVHPESGSRVEGYEVHMGRTQTGHVAPLLEIYGPEDDRPRFEGAVSVDQRVMGSYVHGLFDAPEFRGWFLNRLRARRGWASLDRAGAGSLDADLDALADFVVGALDVAAIEQVIERGI
jgi:adenosylcobyric acid synthase